MISEWAMIFRQPDSSFLNAPVWQPCIYSVTQTLACSFQWESYWHDKTDFHLIHIISKHQETYLTARAAKAVKCSPWGGAESSWPRTWTAAQTKREQVAVNGSFLFGQATEQMLPDTFSSSFLLALGIPNQVLRPQLLEPLSYPTGQLLQEEHAASRENTIANHLGLHKD